MVSNLFKRNESVKKIIYGVRIKFFHPTVRHSVDLWYFLTGTAAEDDILW